MTADDSHAEVLGREEALTARWLTARLRAAGALARGRVQAIRETANDAFTSRGVHLAVEYSEDASPGAPSALFLKRMDRGWGEREIRFYRTVMEERDEKRAEPLARCFDAAFDPVSGGSHLLLEDLSATHVPAVSRTSLIDGDGMPSAAQLEAIMTSLARFHARWWQDRRIGHDEPFLVRPWYSDQWSFDAHVRRRESELRILSDAGVVSEATLDLYEGALRRLPHLWDRYLADRVATRRALTLTHGDCYPTQWLCPREGGGQTYLVDFDSAGGNLGAFDLVYLLASFWRRGPGRAVEVDLLRAYHQTLLSEGIKDYDWTSLTCDYRLMLSFFVFDPVFDHANGSPRGYWWPKMSCLTSAYGDWDCAAL